MGKFIDFLTETDLFLNLNRTQLELIESIAEEQVFQRGQIIFPENSHQNELYLILDGVVEILINPAIITADPHAAPSFEPIAVLRRGQCFGEIALVDEGVRSATARASKNDTHLLRISAGRLLRICDSYPELGYQLMRNLAVELGQKIRLSNLRAREEMLYRKQARANNGV